jgi:hypothetical protein
MSGQLGGWLRNLIAQKKTSLGRATTIHTRLSGRARRRTDGLCLAGQGQALSELQLSHSFGGASPAKGRQRLRIRRFAALIEFDAIGERQEFRLQNRKNA